MSAAPKSRLGRGLGGLIASAAPATPKAIPASSPAEAPAAAAPAPGYQEIAVHLVESSP